MSVQAATRWRTNAAMIADCARLGYLRREWATLDPTYGKGNWWTEWRPAKLAAYDLNPDCGVHVADFRHLPIVLDSFDAAVFDPPYIAQGGRETSTEQEFISRFGLRDAPRTPDAIRLLIHDGLRELRRVVKPGGFILSKAKNYVTSGHLYIGAHYMVQDGIDLGLELVDLLQFITDGVVGADRHERQLHARNNYSTLAVWKVPPW